MDKRFDEVSPPGWSGTTKAMKKHKKDIDNPFALAWYMKNKGDKPHYKPEPGDTSKSKKKPEKKEKYKHEEKPKHKKFKEWLGERGVLTEQPAVPAAGGAAGGTTGATAAAPATNTAAATQPAQKEQQAQQQIYTKFGQPGTAVPNAQVYNQIVQMWTQAGMPANTLPVVIR